MPRRALQANQSSNVHVYEQVDSTQLEARRLLDAGNAAPFWVVAKSQSAARGRSGRGWQSKAGSYSGSLVVPMPADKSQAPKYSLLTAYALFRTLKALGAEQISLKWPNDVLVDRRKIAGILLEVEGDYLIIGTGVNLCTPPDEHALEGRAMRPAYLAEFAEISFEQFHQEFSNHLETAIANFQTDGFEPVRQALNGDLLVREDLIFDDGKASTLIRAEGLGKDGELLVIAEGQPKALYAGDLWMLER